jgi:5-amino-6-(5-phosphoribosylamino)uracil reductase
LEFRQLHPEPARLELQDALDSLAPAKHRSGERPYVLVNFIASADGRSAFQGRSGELGDDGDRAMFHGLRERVDAVLVGTRTATVEGYGRILGRPERRERRAAAGRTPEPLACLVSRSGRLPVDGPLFAEPEARVLVFCSEEPDLDGARAQIEVIELEQGQLTLTTALRRLRSDYGVELLLCEGGPMMFGSLLDEDLVDELFLTVAPKLTGGGTAPAITSGAELTEPRELELAWVLERSGSLYLRYRVRG